MQKHLRLVTLPLLLALSGLPLVQAQTGRGTIRGTVKDMGQSILVGARVELDPTGKRR